MTTARLEVSGVPLQGGYVAKQCPVRPQWDVIRPAEPLPASDATRRRFEQGNRFEAEVFAQLAALHPEAVIVERGGPDDRAAREERTIEAIRSGASLIIGGRLPSDPVGRRVGEPDLLMAADDGGYYPVDVKHHATLTDPAASGLRLEARVSTFAEPWWHAAESDHDRAAAKNKADLLQLAHYRRMLEACGAAAPTNRGGIIGKELVVTWYDLDQDIWTTPSVSERRKVRSTMDVYDFEFGFRLDIIATAQQHLEDASVELLVVPVRIGECSSCPWWGHCHEVLEDAGDISLLPRFGWNWWSRHTERGVGTLQALASLDWRTADLLDRGVDLANLFTALDEHDPASPIGEVIGTRKTGQIAKLKAAGVLTATDARGLDERLATYTGVGVGGLAASIDQARARLHPAPALLRRGVASIEVPRGDVEVDLDMENTEDGVYLWGVLVTDRATTGLVEEGYRGFVAWEPLGPDVEVPLFEELMASLADIRRVVDQAGQALRVYCFNESAEAGEMRRLAASDLASPGRSEEVEALVASEAWVDLLAVANDHLVTGTSMGLKHLAPLAGFAWEDDDPGGEQSMLWHDIAVDSQDPEVRTANRGRLLTYNRNDVEATLALREWLDTSGASLPHMEETDVTFGWTHDRS